MTIRLRSSSNTEIRIRPQLQTWPSLSDAGFGVHPKFGGIGAPVVQTNFTTTSSLPSWISFSRTSNATLYNSTGKLTYAPNNVFTYSQDLTNAAWSKFQITVTGNATTAPDGTTTASAVFETAVNNSHELFGNTAPVSGSTYILSFYVKANGRTKLKILCGGVAVEYDLSAVTATNVTGSSLARGISSVGDGWYRGYQAFTATSTGSIDTYLNDGTGYSYLGDITKGIYFWGAQLEAVTYQTTPSTYVATTTAAYYGPRFDYDPSTLAAKGLLIEETRTNTATYSNNITNAAWTKGGVTASISGTSPDGSSNANLLTEDTSTGVHRIFQSSTVAVGVYTLSCFAKPNGRDWIYLYYNGGLAIANFNVSTGAVGSTSGSSFISASTQSVGNGWYRVSMTLNNTTSAGQNLIINLASADNTTSYVGNGTSGMYVYGIQLEAGAFATSYIPTTSASVTRAADVAQLTGSALTVAGANTGSAIVQTTAWLNSTAAARDLLSSATTRRLLYSNSSNTVLSSTDGTTGLNATIGGSGTFTGGAVRSAIGWTSSGRSLVANNGTLTSDSVNLSTGATVTLGGYGSTTTFDGWIASLAIYNQRLPDAILKQKSVVGAPY